MNLDELLLTDEEIKCEIRKYNLTEVDTTPEVSELVEHIIAIVRQAQAEKAFRILEARHRERVERIFADIIKTYPGVNWLYNQAKWQALKRKELEE